VRYLNAYNTNSIGLHTYTDNADDLQYLYSQFEAYHCYNVFPVFDQPSLKAKMTLTAMCPDDWVAVSNSKERKYADAKSKDARHVLERHDIEDFLKFYEDGCVVYEFEQTPKISCYLYAICGGAYKIYEDFDAMHIPQRIYVRKSMDDYVRPKMVFGVTKTTIELYQKNFGARYPFSKVDHVMCPDYKYGAMENVGCITYADNLLFKAKDLTVVDLTWIVVVIQHELCHMWFGNLVTMEWWDDLWLNEAFATSLSYKACSMGGAFVDDYIDESWLHMSAYKRWGLGEDLMPSNHNIQAECASTDTAESLINGITYGKGSSIMKQLIFLIGWETFTNGLKIYFQRHAWGNTVFKDFIGAIQDAIKESNLEKKYDLFDWGKDWIQTKGSNRITQHYEVKDGKIQNYEIKQVPCKYADEIYRFQSFNVGLYDKDGKLVEKVENVALDKTEVTKIPQMDGKPATAAVLLNCDDWGFGHFILDDDTIKVFENSLGNVASNIDRAVIVGQISAMMKQIEFPANKLSGFLKQLMNEQNQNLINAVVQACMVA
jgi:aminopeptidase N